MGSDMVIRDRPVLGVIDWSGEGDRFTLADVPCLLEGAAEGVGLGHEFLAHLERCRLLLHVVDLTGYYGVGPLAGLHTVSYNHLTLPTLYSV